MTHRVWTLGFVLAGVVWIGGCATNFRALPLQFQEVTYHRAVQQEALETSVELALQDLFSKEGADGPSPNLKGKTVYVSSVGVHPDSYRDLLSYIESRVKARLAERGAIVKEAPADVYRTVHLEDERQGAAPPGDKIKMGDKSTLTLSEVGTGTSFSGGSAPAETSIPDVDLVVLVSVGAAGVDVIVQEQPYYKAFVDMVMIPLTLPIDIVMNILTWGNAGRLWQPMSADRYYADGRSVIYVSGLPQNQKMLGFDYSGDSEFRIRLNSKANRWRESKYPERDFRNYIEP